MIRRLQKSEINRVADIWLDTNIKAHSFISAQYWYDNFESVKEALIQAEVYIYETDNKIGGFVGLSNDYIAGIFICSKAQSNGMGKQLLDFVKGIRNELSLSVYQKNARAVKFYQRENFEIQCENVDENTGEKEYLMTWRK